MYPEERDQYEHLKKLVLNDFRIDENDYYYLLKDLLNKKNNLNTITYKLVEKTILNKSSLLSIEKYIKKLKKIESLKLYFEQVKHLLSKNRIIEKNNIFDLLIDIRDDLFNYLLDYHIIYLA